MNLSRSPFGGRNFENFGEDPYLTGRMARAYISGVQSQGVGACMKHFVANDMETRRFNMDEKIDERTLREIYLKPFEMALDAQPLTVMTAYPKINGEHADTSRFLVHDILRQEWAYDGLVMSDWGGLNSTVESIRATTDLEMPGPPLRYGKALMEAVQRGDVSETQDVNLSVERLLRLLKKLNCLEESQKLHPVDSRLENGQPRNHDITAREGESDQPLVRQLVRDAASQGIVLLKNSGLLPLQPAKLRKLAIIGPNAKNPTLGGSGSAIVNPYYTTNPYESLKSMAKQQNPDIEVVHERGIFTYLQPPLLGHCLTQPGSGNPGLRVDFYKGCNFEGEVVARSHWQDSLVYFMSDGDVPESLRGTAFSYKAYGLLRPSVTGTYNFSLSNTGKTKLFIDGDLFIDNTNWTEISGNFMNCGSVECFASQVLEAGKTYELRIDNIVVPPPTKPHDNTLFHKISGVRVGMLFQHDEEAMFANALKAATDADAVVLVVGYNNDTEREGSDRTSLSLPGRTDELISAVCDVNPNVVVVTQSACAISMPWADKPNAILHAWYQSQECGNAVADVIFGSVNPSGKLPITFPRRIEDHGSHKWFPGDAENDKAEYGEGVLVGYRWFDAFNLEPLWPFGYGLSYTTFQISNVSFEGKLSAFEPMQGLLKATVTNTGSFQGAEVVQVYASPSPVFPSSGIVAAPKALAGFRKVMLSPGESKSVEICINRDVFKWFDVTKNVGSNKQKGWRVDKGAYKLFVESSSRHVMEEVDVIVE